ncbi:hypothetical protein GFD17_00775 [Bifidobacterium sp. SMB2]|uniref:Uncharacterized protein n=1 Tax=Bifidobacterium saimiriisciurei TaxID=2661627 RepID=A0ABX0CDE2_9BIFI|nr:MULTISPECIES: hypothetical protein [Bifidobacterium]NEG95315.1 hypothetical protein [Bifidobacterium sp. SMB2]NEH12522.1 hypothetical protein [Bifidobacterium saimiriisciurei]
MTAGNGAGRGNGGLDDDFDDVDTSSGASSGKGARGLFDADNGWVPPNSDDGYRSIDEELSDNPYADTNQLKRDQADGYRSQYRFGEGTAKGNDDSGDFRGSTKGSGEKGAENNGAGRARSGRHGNRNEANRPIPPWERSERRRENRRNSGQTNGKGGKATARAAAIAQQRTQARRRRLLGLLLVVIIIASAAGGFAWRSHALHAKTNGSSLNCSSHTGGLDAGDYCYGGFTPLEPHGPKLAESQAGPYFTKAVAGTSATDDAVRMAAAAGDVSAVNAAAEKAYDTADHAAKTLAARTWPGNITKAMRMVIVEYQGKAAIYANLRTNRNPDAIDNLALDVFKPSGAQTLVRSMLKLEAEPEPAVPFEIMAVRDAGSCETYDVTTSRPTKVQRRCVDITVKSRMPAKVSAVGLQMNLLDADGTVRLTDISALSSASSSSSSDSDASPNPDESPAIEPGGTATVSVYLNPRNVWRGGRIAVSQWSVHDANGKVHLGDFTAKQMTSFAAVNDFRFP